MESTGAIPKKSKKRPSEEQIEKQSSVFDDSQGPSRNIATTDTSRNPSRRRRRLPSIPTTAVEAHRITETAIRVGDGRDNSSKVDEFPRAGAVSRSSLGMRVSFAGMGDTDLEVYGAVGGAPLEECGAVGGASLEECGAVGGIPLERLDVVAHRFSEQSRAVVGGFSEESAAIPGGSSEESRAVSSDNSEREALGDLLKKDAMRGKLQRNDQEKVEVSKIPDLLMKKRYNRMGFHYATVAVRLRNNSVVKDLLFNSMCQAYTDLVTVTRNRREEPPRYDSFLPRRIDRVRAAYYLGKRFEEYGERVKKLNKKRAEKPKTRKASLRVVYQSCLYKGLVDENSAIYEELIREDCDATDTLAGVSSLQADSPKGSDSSEDVPPLQPDPEEQEKGTLEEIHPDPKYDDYFEPDLDALSDLGIDVGPPSDVFEDDLSEFIWGVEQIRGETEQPTYRTLEDILNKFRKDCNMKISLSDYESPTEEELMKELEESEDEED